MAMQYKMTRSSCMIADETRLLIMLRFIGLAGSKQSGIDHTVQMILLREYLLGVIVGFMQTRFNTHTFK
jgi:hypothetical protein